MSVEDDSVGAEGQGGINFIASLPAILWDRRWLVIVPILLGVVAAIAAIALLPRTYRSSATLVVESPQLPNEITGILPDNQIDRRIARIREQLISRPDLVALINSQGLYTSERQRLPLSEVIEKMRDAIELTPTVSQMPAGASANNAISFELSFDYRQPDKAQAVAQALMERLLNLETTQNQAQANNSVQFLSDQASTLQSQIKELEGQIIGISAKNGRALATGSMPTMMGGGADYEVQIASLTREIANLTAQRRAALAAGSADPRVAAAQAALQQAQAIYADNHPDVIFARQRLAQAKAQASASGQTSAVAEIDKQIAMINGQISSLQASRNAQNAQLSASMAAQAQGPLAQQQLSLVQQKLTELNTQYQEVSRRLLAAKAGARANDERLGERLTVVDPPVVPDAPHSPNRILLGALGVIAGLAGGFLLALVVEGLMRPIRSADDLLSIDGRAPIATVPVVEVARGRGGPQQSGFFRGWGGFGRKRAESV